jgi:hypothetical protein
MSSSFRRRPLSLPVTTLVPLAAIVAACQEMDGMVVGPPVEATEDLQAQEAALQGENMGGSNLGGINLGGINMAGTNLGGINLGGINLSGGNLGGINMAGTNMGGNNLGGINMAGSNLGGINLSGTNLGGINLGGINLAATNLGGSGSSGTNTAGNSVTGTTLNSSNLSGATTGRNIHNLSGSINGLLYSAEDLWTPKSAQCIVSGIGSTAFAKLLGQQSANARISVALGKLPWGFATSASGPINLRAWEAIVWGDRTYCVFVMGTPTDTTWAGVAGFIKAIFRWNAPPTQSMDISGIEAARTLDASTSTAIATYTGMMNAGARFRAGTITDRALVAGELAFASATTNNQSVQVDFASWVQDSNKNALVLGDVTSSSPPTYAEALYIALDNGDGTVQVIIDDAASRTTSMPAGMTNSVVDLDIAYLAWQEGLGPKPVPRRCGGALFLNTVFGEPVPAGKCDSGLKWATGFCSVGSNPWSTVSGTTAPSNGYMQLTKNGGLYKRALEVDGACGPLKTVLSETYVHMWERNYDVPVTTCTPETDGSFCSRRSKNCGAITGTDNCGATRTVSSCGGCATGTTCGGGGAANVCGNSSTRTYEAEANGHTLSGTAVTNVCIEAFAKTLAGRAPPQINGACWAGGRIRWIGNGSSNHVTINNVNVPTTGSYTLTVWAMALDPRYFDISVNGGSSARLNVQTPAWDTPEPFSLTVNLNAGNNTIKFFNSSAYAPDLDRIVVSPAGSSSSSSNPTLTVHDTANASGWSIKSNFQIGSSTGKPWSDNSSYVISWNSSLNNLLGKSWISPKNASKNYTGGNQATVNLPAAKNVYLLVDDRWGTPVSIPTSWTSGWTDTGYNVKIREGSSTDRTFSAFKKTGVSGNVTLPKIGANNAFNYFVVLE